MYVVLDDLSTFGPVEGAVVAVLTKAGDDEVDVRESATPALYRMPIEMKVPYHQPHLVNFFESVRGNQTLNCPGEIGYETAVMVVKVNVAIAAARKIEVKPEDFKV